MADEQKNTKNAKNQILHLRAKKFSRSLIIVSIVLFGLGITSASFSYHYVFYVLVVGMTPSIFSYLMDFRPGKPASKTIIAFNIAGIAQPFNTIITAGSPNQAAEFVLSNPEQWILAYGFSAFGCGVIYLLPHLTTVYLEIKARYLVTRMQEARKELENEWGEEVKK